MNKERLSAFTDGVVAVIITIMVLELKPPHGTDLKALIGLAPTFSAYALSFIYVAIYWNNHHHFFTLVDKVNGAVLWANLQLLFWISLVPFTTAWVGENLGAPLPTALYGVSLCLAAIGWYIMQTTIIHFQGEGSALKGALGSDWKGKLSPFLYAAGIACSFLNTAIADLIYVGVAMIWLIPDRRVENKLQAGEVQAR